MKAITSSILADPRHVRRGMRELANACMEQANLEFPDDPLSDKLVVIRVFLQESAEGAIGILRGKGIDEDALAEVVETYQSTIEEMISAMSGG